MRILFIGDVVGKSGRAAVEQLLPNLKKKEKIDFAVANAENVTHGRGAKIEHLRELQKAGVDLFTSGDHIFYLDPNEPFSDPAVPVIRPANLPEATPGGGSKIVGIGGEKGATVSSFGGGFFGGKHAHGK